jgi:hypothetical protein
MSLPLRANLELLVRKPSGSTRRCRRKMKNRLLRSGPSYSLS